MNLSTNEKYKEPEVKNELSKVATNPKRNMLIMLGIAGIGAYIGYALFFNTSSSDTKSKLEIPKIVSKPAENIALDGPNIPKLPEIPPLVDPTPPAPPPLPPKEIAPINTHDSVLDSEPPPLPTNVSLPSSSSINTELNDDVKRRNDIKRKSSVVLIAGKQETKTPEQIDQESSFKLRGDMALVLGRGKIIDAVLESAISTDFPGEIRAVVSRDVFSENGKTVLISKGSRVFGLHNTTTDNSGYGRIVISWNRIDMATGYTLNLEGSGIDNLGRKGDQGRVDNKIKEKISNAVLMSIFDIGLAKALDKLVPPPENSQVAAQNQAASTQINNLAQSISAANTPGQEGVTIAQICAQVQTAIPDKTSTAFTGFLAACNGINTVAGTPAQRLASIVASANAAATALASISVAQIMPSQAQNASKEAFTNLSKTLKDLVGQNQLKPTITIDQGTPVKIYVNRDYKFPRATVARSRMLN